MRPQFARCIPLGLALGLMAAAPSAVAQKMYKCSDGKGGTVFQQERCGESEKEAEARSKEQARIAAEKKAKQDEEARRKAEAIAKGRERDAAYQQQLKDRAAAQKAAAEAERKILEGTAKEGGVDTTAVAAAAAGAAPSPVSDDDVGLPPHVASTYPGPWKTGRNTIIASALGKKQVVGCDKYRYRQRPNGEFMVNCIPGKNHYFVWPSSEAVSGPVKF